MTRPRLYQRCKAMGRRAGIVDAHPASFSGHFRRGLLARGATPYDVAKLLGDEISTIEKHYAPFVRELRERVRTLMETGEGLHQYSGAETKVRSPKTSLNVINRLVRLQCGDFFKTGSYIRDTGLARWVRRKVTRECIDKPLNAVQSLDFRAKVRTHSVFGGLNFS
jgi:hypothetical protein